MMEDLSLRDAFVRRDGRYQLLDKGLELAGIRHDQALLEIGCAGGEGTEHLVNCGYRHLWAIDIDQDILAQARERVEGCVFLCADACRLPFRDGSFDGIVSEAAFSVIPDKASAAGEYARVLRTGGRLLVNDFCLRAGNAPDRAQGLGIPALEGAQTMDMYKRLMEEHGLMCVFAQEKFADFIRIAISLSHIFKVSPSQVGQHIVSAFGSDGYVTDFFENTRMSYCQMIFEKV